MSAMLETLLTGYSYFPHHPGKGKLYDRLLPRLNPHGIRHRSRYGVKFECDLADKLTREIYYIGFDRRDCGALKKLIRPGMTVFDVGANIGYFSLLCASWLRGTGAVHAFEPFPQTATRFERNLHLNSSLRNVLLHQIALSDFNGTVDMETPDAGNAGCNYLSRHPGLIPVTTLDAFAASEGIARLDLLKIDVEGSELALLRGAAEALERFRPVLMIEINESTLRKFGSSAAELVAWLRAHEYLLMQATRVGRLAPLNRNPGIGEEPNIFAFPRFI